MGGVKQSGLGRRNGPEGLLRFVEPVTISHATGLVQLPRTGGEFAALSGVMLVMVAGAAEGHRRAAADAGRAGMRRAERRVTRRPSGRCAA